MYRIDNSSASTIQPTPKPLGNPGFFTAGTIGGEAATIVEADWLNQVQEELMNVLAADALAPSKTEHNQVITAILDLIAKNTRRRLTGPLDLYVSNSGSDTNDGLTPSTPWATPQRAYNYVMERIDIGAQTVTVHLEDGQYPAFQCVGTPVGAQGASVIFQGNLNFPTSVVINGINNAAVYAANGASVQIKGMQFRTSGTLSGPNPACLLCSRAVLYFETVDFGMSVGAHMLAIQNGVIVGTGNYSISGDAAMHIWNNSCGIIGVRGIQIALGAPDPNFAQAFIVSSGLGFTDFDTVTYTGTAIGKRFDISSNATLYCAGADPNTIIPGSIAGTTATGGVVY